ncbi:DoxX family protein OS=Streptomyces rochei OX=1928 GN=G3I25_11070 PE=4 SV=1 [Streptomyces rochei]|uniref:DoxX family protein n=1 Tax=Streptomyces TaxID=1883 RepID=UPI0004C9F836|nr:DoxX family protein [Streptomyces sp. NRRL WC-3795]
MNIAYWIAAGPLALFYLYAGTLKLVRDPDRLRPMMAWVDRVPLPALRALGALEVLGAAGLVLPGPTGIAPASAPAGIAPASAPAAALGFVLLQAGAIVVHLTGGDRRIALNVTLAVIAAAAFWTAVVR